MGLHSIQPFNLKSLLEGPDTPHSCLRDTKLCELARLAELDRKCSTQQLIRQARKEDSLSRSALSKVQPGSHGSMGDSMIKGF